MCMRKCSLMCAVCLLLSCLLCSCTLFGGEEQSIADKWEGMVGAVVVTDENGSYVLEFGNGSGMGDVIIEWGDGSLAGYDGAPDPLTEIDAYEASMFVQSEKPTDYVKITVRNYGEMVVRLLPSSAPETVKNFKALVHQGFYDGLIFHRVIQNFMIQGGGFRENGEQKQAEPIKGEFDSNGVKNPYPHVRGAVSMARANDKDSATSQFFICDVTSARLDGEYAVFGYVVAGMEVVDAIAATNTDSMDKPYENVVIESMTFVSPAKD